MRPPRTPALTPSFALATLLLGALLAGCLAPEPKPSPGNRLPPDFKSYENQPDGWQQLNGSFKLYRLTSDMEYLGAGDDKWQPLQSSCTWLKLWEWDGVSLSLANRHAVHPTLPGNLSAIWVNTVNAGPDCPEQGFFGINENPMERRFAFVQRTLPNGTIEDLIRLHVTFERTEDSPPRHTVTVNGQVFGDNQSGYAVWQTEDPTTPGDHYRIVTHVEALGEVPLANVYRYR